MILSVSRRTDIPAFYSEWFFNRLREGYALVRNPMNTHQISKVTLDPEVIDCIVFWTKDPSKMLPKLELLAQYNYYFQVTITGYDASIEPNLAPKEEIIASFKQLTKNLGKARTIWRYDPIIITKRLDRDFHRKKFAALAESLAQSTEKCVISFVDLYKKTQRNIKGLGPVLMDDQSVLEIAQDLSILAKQFGLTLETCSESLDLTRFGIKAGKCIDDALISRIVGEQFDIGKDPNQRLECGCVSSIDIGAYNTCSHRCIYCYANFSPSVVQNNQKQHDPKSPLLLGQIGPEDKITERKMTSYTSNQLKLF